MKSRHIVISLLMWILVQSCTGTGYDVATTPEGSRLDIVFDFSEATNKPDSIPGNTRVLMSETVSDKRYLFDTQTGFSICKENEFPVNNGEYFILSLSSQQDDYLLTGKGSLDDPENPITLSSMKLTIKDMSKEQIYERYGHCVKGIANQFQTFPPTSPLYISIDNDVPVYYREPGEKITLTLKPAERSVSLTFSVNIELEPDVAVDSVFAGVSGVSYNMMFMEGSVGKDTLGVSFFKMTPDNGSYTSSGTYSGTLDTWGLFSADFGDYITGPGIFWLSVVASCEGKSRAVSAGLNIKEQIDEAKLMKSEDDGQTWKLATKKATLPIQKTIRISKEMILSGGNDGAEGWIPVEDEENPIVIEI